MRIIEIDQTITVSNLAQQLEIPATHLISELLKNGVMLTINEKIDFDTATILIGELGLDVKVQQKVNLKTPHKAREGIISKTRPPVVAIMGHVDHGKTSLLDKIRGSNQVSVEAGGITQHISAQLIEHQGRFITFLDTPGHEAFANVREHGAFLTDLVVLIVAADDGVKEQTVEAIRFAKKAGVKIVVAISKMDKENANIHLVKQQLAEHGLLAEDMGGKIVFLPFSAKTGEGVDQLLDMILLTADIENLQADSHGRATGLVIEAYMKQGLGPVAVVLVQEGVVQRGDLIVAGRAWGKIRLMQDMSLRPLEQAGPSVPVIISGFKSLPEFGASFEVVENEKLVKKLISEADQQHDVRSSGMSSRELLRIIDRRTEVNEHKAIIKADVHGSLTAILDGIKVLETDEVATRIVGSGVGSISESDISSAKISGATIYCFNLNPVVAMRQLALRSGVDLKTYEIIYELLSDVKGSLEELLPPKIIKTDLGKLRVKGIFKTTRSELLCGGEVIDGKLSLPAQAKVKRGDELLAEVEVSSLARGPTDVKEVTKGSMCGVKLATTAKINLKEEDILEFYRLKTEIRKL